MGAPVPTAARKPPAVPAGQTSGRSGGWPLWKSASVAVAGCLATVGVIGGAGLWLMAPPTPAPPAAVSLALPSPDPGPSEPAPAPRSTPPAPTSDAAPPALGGGAALSVPAVSATAFAGIPFVPPSPALPPAPVAGLYEDAAEGRLPIIAVDGGASRTAYAKPFSAPPGIGRIGLVILDAGLSPVATEAAIYRLPSDVTLAFSVYSDTPQRWVDRARQAGHEVVLALPFRVDPAPHRDLGPLAIGPDLDPAERTLRLRRLLASAVGYVGLVGDLGRVFADSPEAGAGLVGDFRDRGLLYLDAGGPGEAAGPAAEAAWAGRATAAIGPDAGPAEIDAMLAALEEAARQEGRAVGLAFPTPLALERISTWAVTLRERALTLTPLSAVVSPEPS